MNYSIRECRLADLTDLVKLCENHASYECAAYFAEGKLERLKHALFSEAKVLHCLVVEVEKVLAGYCSFTFDYSTWNASYYLHIDCLFLEPAYRGGGIGEEIMKRLKLVATQRGCIEIQWQTPVFNDRAIKFYERSGGTGMNKIRFTLKLAD